MSIGRVPGSTGIQPSIVTAKGDLIAATANSSVSRLAVGTNGQYLKADSTAATGLAWATLPADTNGFVYITGASFSAVSSFSLPTNTFSTTYKNYKIFVTWSAFATASDLTIRCRTAGTDFTGSNYFYGGGKVPYNTGTLSAVTGSAVNAWKVGITDYYDRSAAEFTYYDPKGGGNVMTAQGMFDNIQGGFMGLYQNGTSNVDSLTFAKASGTMTGYYRVYGLADA
jgi:hypothetical protein